MVKLDFESYFKARYPQHAFLIQTMRNALDVSEVTYEDLTVTGVTRIKDYMLNVEQKKNSTVKQYMTKIAASCNILACEGNIRPVNFELVGRVKADKCENVALTEDEVHLFVDYYKRLYTQDKHQATKDVLTLFLIELFTGARSCDCETFSRKDIKEGVLAYVSQKTHTLTRVPVHSMLPLLLSRLPHKQYSRMTKNRTIKRVAERLGITKQERRNYRGVLKMRPRYEYLGTHSARRTFVSTLLDKEVPIATVSKMCGHSSVNMTLRYWVSDGISLDEKAMAFFRG